MNKNKIDFFITGASILLLLFVTISASYAYFSSRFNGDSISLNVTTNTSEAATFTAYAVDQIEFNVTAEELYTPSATPAKSDNGQVVVVLASPTEGKTVHCTYDILFTWDTTDQYTSPSTSLTGDTKFEISLLGHQEVTGDNTGHTYTKTSLAETNLSNFTWIRAAGEIGRYSRIVSGAEIYSNSTNQTKITWTFTLNFYSLSADQSGLMGKTYGAHLGVGNVVC